MDREQPGPGLEIPRGQRGWELEQVDTHPLISAVTAPEGAEVCILWLSGPWQILPQISISRGSPPN